MTPLIHHIFLTVTIGACAAAAALDVRTGNIPNWLTLGLFLTSPVAHAVIAFGHHHQSFAAAGASFGMSLASGVAAGLVPYALARSGGLGMGDVKLFAAIGAACGVLAAFYAQTYAYVFTMVYALAFMACRGQLATTLENVRSLLTNRSSRSKTGPTHHAGFTELKFAPAILAGMCVAAWSQWRA